MNLSILQICNKPPYPPIDGGCIAMNTVTSGLIDAGCHVKVLTIETPKHALHYDLLPKEYIEKTQIESVFVDTSINLVDAFSAMITSDSYNISRFFSPDFDRKLIEVLKKHKFDIVQVESLFMTPYIGTIRRTSKAKIVLRSHNLEYIIWENLAKGTKSFPKKTYLKILASQLKKYELNVIKDVDGIATISSEDYKKYISFKTDKPIVNIPFGVDLKKYRAGKEKMEENSIFHIGAMDWAPNVEGVDWFIKNVWPTVHKKNKQLKFYIAGKAMPDKYTKLESKNIFCLGEVENARTFMDSKKLMVVPLLSAGGIRVKIIEGMALRKCIVSTQTGADGIDFKVDKNIAIANDGPEFANKILELFDNPEAMDKMAGEARLLAQNKYDNNLLSRDLLNFYYSVIP
ncbi:MAG TPA: glycosyltransferase family 4 protein [Flavobacteriales bacterium]|nr:glycosyltransferase family 4 protein [Flavobacteriales bacterium]